VITLIVYLLSLREGADPIGELKQGLPLGLTLMLSFGLLLGLVSGLVGGFTDTVKVGKASPNQGTMLSLRNSFAVFLVTTLTVELMMGLGALLTHQIMFYLFFGLMIGLLFGLITGLNRGGSAVIKHYALRLILWIKRDTPFNFIKFLDHC